VLYILADGRSAALPYGCSLDQIGMAATRLNTARRAARQLADARYTFSEKLQSAMKAEAKAKVHQAVHNLLRGLVMLRAGFVC
jgi:uridylate kinase